MSAVVISTRPFFNDLLRAESKMLDKIQKERYKLGMSKSIEKAYKDAYKKHRDIPKFIPARKMEEVFEKLKRENKLIVMRSSGIKAKTKEMKIEGMQEKHKKFVELAIALNANYLITEVRYHLSISGELKRKFNIEVVRPEDWYDK
ncbi:hypothetical protein KAW50_08765 [candidate division WOR-3 bacterium]|nr:hypothetical protein [candidate division WOR-3 bacterium]